MKQIYDFEQRTPPVLNEQMLRAELERRKLRIQTAVAVLAGFLLMIAAVLWGTQQSTGTLYSLCYALDIS